MRQALRKALINLGFFGERIYEMQVPSKDTEKPFCVVRFLADTVDNEWLGYRRTVEIYPYLPRTSFLSVDETVKAIIQGLDRQLITDIETGEVFTCLYRSSGQDFVDDEWDAITRVLTFDILALRYVEQVESYSDEWISDIIQALNENLSGWTFYSGYLPQGYNTPCMLLRVRSSNIIRLGHSISKELKTIKIHVLAGTTTERQDGITSLVYLFRIGDKVKIGNNFYIVDKFISVNEANPYSEGQITVDLSKITIEKEEGTKINAVNKKEVVLFERDKKKISESLEANVEKYLKEELIALSEKLFKTRREIVAGALASAEEELSVSEAKMLIEKFLNRRVR